MNRQRDVGGVNYVIYDTQGPLCLYTITEVITHDAL